MPLPKEVLRERVRNEIGMCAKKLRHPIAVSDAAYGSFPMLVEVTLVNVPGPVMKAGKVTHRLVHKMQVYITEDYPYQKPIVVWGTEIFHPNIMLPADGGAVCTKLLDKWSLGSSIYSFIRGVEHLLMNPNPKSPYATPSCAEAAEHFAREPYSFPPELYRAASDKEGD